MRSLSLAFPKDFPGQGTSISTFLFFGIFVISYFLLLIFYYLFALFLSRGFSFSLPKDFPGHSTFQPLISCCIDCILHLSRGAICHWWPQCNIFASGVNFSRNQHIFSHNKHKNVSSLIYLCFFIVNTVDIFSFYLNSLYTLNISNLCTDS